ncbi:MAG: glutamyl-tRNA reductase [Opitutaceae bacterium]|nr:glutamyl-tRNA reductase [Opitutaceae bacterium]
MSSPGPLLFHVGASHQRAPLELREKIALPPERAAALHERLAASGLAELALLNTCNRVEFYGVAATPADIEALDAAFCAVTGLSADAYAGIRAHAAGPDAIRHLASVAAGLESQLLGENEIFGQVKDAYASAQASGRVGPVLNRVFQKAFQAAKHVRTHTAISEGQVSVANVAVELALTIFGDLESSRVLLLGAGDIGEKTAKAFKSRGARALTVASRTPERALALARTLDATALPFEHFSRHLGDYDILVSATSAPGSIVHASDIAASRAKRRGAPLLLLDLALPRDIDAEAAHQENVYLYNLDDLAQIAARNLAAREAEVARARALIAEKADAIWQQIVSRHGA